MSITPYVSYIPYEVEYDYNGFVFLVHFDMLGRILQAWKFDVTGEHELATFLEANEVIEAQEQVDRVLAEWDYERRMAKLSGGYNEDYT